MKLLSQVSVAVAVVMVVMATGDFVRIAGAVIANQSENFNDGNFANNGALGAAGYTFSGSGGLDGGQLAGDPDSFIDGINDGGIFVGGVINNTVTFPFAGTIEDGALYQFGANLFASGGSATLGDVELLANGTTVVASQAGFGAIDQNDLTSGGAAPATLYFRGDAATAGQTLSFRVRQQDTDDLGIDNWELTNVDLSTPIANQFDTLSVGAVPFGYTWSKPGEGGFTVTNGVDRISTANSFFPGDAAGDGGIFVNGQSPGAGASSYVEYRFDGVLEDGMQYDFSTFLYQASGSFANSDIQLGVIDPAGDVDDPSNFTVVENTFRNGINNGSDLKRVNLRYTATSATDGQLLGFRVTSQRNNNPGTDAGIDSWLLEVVDPDVPIADQFETFSLGSLPVGYVLSPPATLITSDIPGSTNEGIQPDYDDRDPATPAMGAFPGDGVADGSLAIDEVDDPLTEGPNTVTHTFLGFIEDNMQYDFTAYLSCSSSGCENGLGDIFANSTVELITDLSGPNETIVDTIFLSEILATDDPSTPDSNQVAELTFVGDLSTAGQSLSFRASSELGTSIEGAETAIDAWSLSVSSAGIPGDFDGDGDVDGADFLEWQRNDGTPAGLSDWQTNYGPGASAAVSTVPEPSSLLLLLLGSSLLTRVRRRSCRSIIDI